MIEEAVIPAIVYSVAMAIGWTVAALYVLRDTDDDKRPK